MDHARHILKLTVLIAISAFIAGLNVAWIGRSVTPLPRLSYLLVILASGAAVILTFIALYRSLRAMSAGGHRAA
jgi:hypothetical protein